MRQAGVGFGRPHGGLLSGHPSRTAPCSALRDPFRLYPYR
jgi:hypothetical protein